MDILVVGSIALDTVETPWGAVEDEPGGSATYFSVAASTYCPVKLVAIVGEDFPDSCHQLFAQRGIDCEGLVIEPGQSFRWGGRYYEDVNRRDTLFTHLNVFEHFHPKLPDSYKDAAIVFLANIHPSLQMEVLEQVEQPQMVAADTMNLWIETAREDLGKLLQSVDLLFLNDEEARQLTGLPHLAQAAAALQAMGPSTIVIKKGEHGAVLFGKEDRFAVPAVLLDRVTDPTGAGDAFAGGFLGYLAQAGRFDAATMRHAMVRGTVLASFATESFGVSRLAGLEPVERAGRRKQLQRLAAWPD